MAIENLRFEIYFRFSRIQTYRTFYFLRGLFANNQTLSSQFWIFSSRSRSHKIRLLSISKFLFLVVIVTSILLKTTFSQISVQSQLLVKILQRSDREKTLLRRLKNIGMASEKLYRNTFFNGKPFGRIIRSLELHAFNRLEISFKYKLNRRGERTHPSRTPLPQVKKLVLLFPKFMLHFVLQTEPVMP